MRIALITLMYHEIVKDAISKYSISIDTLKTHLESLLKITQPITFEEFDPLKYRKHTNLIITFDDGHFSNYEAAKELNKIGVKGVFYIVKNFSLFDTNFLSVNQIKEISEMGHEIGVHGKDHDWWTYKDINVLISEINETKEWLESIISKKVISCSAPGGKINKKIASDIYKNIPEIKYIRSIKPNIFFNYRKTCVGTFYVHTNTSINELTSIVKLRLSTFLIRSLEYNIKYFVKQVLKK